MWSRDTAALILNVGTRWRFDSFTLQPSYGLEIPQRFAVLWRLFLPLNLYANFVEEINIFALPGIELKFLECLARYLLKIRI